MAGRSVVPEDGLLEVAVGRLAVQEDQVDPVDREDQEDLVVQVVLAADGAIQLPSRRLDQRPTRAG